MAERETPIGQGLEQPQAPDEIQKIKDNILEQWRSLPPDERVYVLMEQVKSVLPEGLLADRQAYETKHPPQSELPKAEDIVVELQAMHRLWEVFVQDFSFGNDLLAVEAAWRREDDQTIVETLRNNWYLLFDPLVDSMLLSYAFDDESRAWAIYRQWVRHCLRNFDG